MKNLDSLNLSINQRKIIEDYLNDLKDYVDLHKIDTEVYNDIEEMFIDKLYSTDKLDDLFIKKSINEVGKPEDIFWDYSVENENNDTKKEMFYKKLLNKWWTRDNEGAILLWISKLLSKKIWISVLAVRVLLIIFILFWWLSVWIYFIAWLVLPVKWVEYKTDKLSNYFSFQFVYLIKNLVCNFSLFIKKSFSFILSKSISIFRFIYNFIKNNIFPILRFLLFMIVSFFILLFLLMLIILTSAYFSDFTILNINFLSVLPNYFIYWAILWIISLTIFLIWSIWYWLNKKFLNKYIYYFSIVSFIIFVFLFISTWLNTLKTYIGSWNIQKKSSIDISNYWTWNININLSELDPFGLNWFNNSYPWLVIKSSTWSRITANLKLEVLWSDKIYNTINKNLNDIELKFDNWYLSLWYFNSQTFKNEVPFTFIDYGLELYLPKSNNYYIDWVYYYFQNVFINDNFVYWKYLDNNCNYELIYYSDYSNSFICDASDYNTKEAKEKFLINNLVTNYDNYSDIKHIDKYKRTYYWNYWVSSDWSFDEIDIEENTIYFEISDKSLEIEARIDYSIGSEGVLFSNFFVSDIDSNYNYDKKYYIENNYDIKKD